MVSIAGARQGTSPALRDATGPGRDPLLAAFDGAGLRITAPRRAVATLIRAREGTFTAADLIGDADARGIDIGRATVFRSLDVLTELGRLERIDLPTGERAYVQCSPAHHHHVVCGSCGRSTGVGDLDLAAALAEIERVTGYAVDSHRLELYGRCPRCRASS